MTEEDSAAGPSGSGEGCSRQQEPPGDSLSSQRVFKKSSPNNKLTLYLSTRDLVVSAGKIDRLQGVLLVDPDFVEDRKVYGQITLTFRYGREDEEVMGLKFCNEAVMCLAQLYPMSPPMIDEITPLQEALMKRLGPNAYPFCMEITPLAPPSVQLVPAKEYNGAPIGTSYDVRAYISDKVDEKVNRRTTVRMGIRVMQKTYAPPSPYGYQPGVSQSASQKPAGGKHKLALFGCKSAPLDSSKLFGLPLVQTSKSKSVEGGLQIKTKQAAAPTTASDGKQLQSLIKSKESKENKENDDRLAAFARPSNGERSPCKVTFEPPSDEHQDAGGIIDDPMEGCSADSAASTQSDTPAPHAVAEKYFLLSDGRIELDASLDRAFYHHGDEVTVTVHVHNNSNKTIKRIKVFVVQHVDVCMFSNGKFKNVVATVNGEENLSTQSSKGLTRTYSLTPVKSSTKNWIALEDSYTKSGVSLASTVTSVGNHPEERNVFAIYVSYYVKVTLVLGLMGGHLSLKLPFCLMHSRDDYDPTGTLTRMVESAGVGVAIAAPRSPLPLPSPQHQADGAVGLPKPEKDGT